MEHRLELGKFHVRNLLPNSIYKVMTIVLCSQQAAAYTGSLGPLRLPAVSISFSILHTARCPL